MKTRKRKQKSFSYNFQKGKIGQSVIVIITVIVFGLFFVGGIFAPKTKFDGKAPAFSNTSACCDTGDGDKCTPQTDPDKKITYEGKEYGLIRTKVTLTEGNLHLQDSGETTTNGEPIILNSTETHHPNDAGINQACGRTSPGDIYFKKNPPDPYMFMTSSDPALLAEYCAATPDDQMIFVCKKNCFAGACTYPAPGITCYGDTSSEYDVYFRLSDYPAPGIPDFIRYCDKSINPNVTNTAQQQVIEPNEIDRKNLHLNTFRIATVGSGSASWLSPLCKPAIYLYPEKKESIHVKIAPQGKITYTLPLYPHEGWTVTANPNGQIEYQNSTYPYLYYEAEIPNSSYTKPKEGFIIEKKNIEEELNTLLFNLGLNEKEKKEFVEYWVDVLPNSPFYFVGIIPEKTLNEVSPLFITPKPKTILRVTLFFEALDTKKNVIPPVIQSTQRNGFTVVEWGGIFQRDENHPFSCFM